MQKSNMPVMEVHFCNCYSFAQFRALRKKVQLWR